MSDKPQISGVGCGEGSASQINHHKYQVAVAHDLMSRMNELQQAEKIARHYLSHAASAQYLLKIVETARYGEMTDDTKAAIKHLADQIRNNHAHDLGLELSWPNNKVRQAPAGALSVPSGSASDS